VGTISLPSSDARAIESRLMRASQVPGRMPYRGGLEKPALPRIGDAL